MMLLSSSATFCYLCLSTLSNFVSEKLRYNVPQQQAAVIFGSVLLVATSTTEYEKMQRTEKVAKCEYTFGALGVLRREKMVGKIK